MNELYIELRRRSFRLQKKMAGTEAPAISMGCRGVNLEYELQSELKLPGALRSGDPAERTAALVKRTSGRAAAESPDGVVESVERIKPEQ